MTVPFTPSAGSFPGCRVVRAVCGVLLLRELVFLRLLCVRTSIYIRVPSAVIWYVVTSSISASVVVVFVLCVVLSVLRCL